MMVAGFVLEMFFGWLVGVFFFMGLQKKSSLRTKNTRTPQHTIPGNRWKGRCPEFRASSF
jgi:hypothetical protein